VLTRPQGGQVRGRVPCRDSTFEVLMCVQAHEMIHHVTSCVVTRYGGRTGEIKELEIRASGLGFRSRV
jgi:hypothetical protein